MKIVEYTVNVGNYDLEPVPNFICINDINIFRNNARNSRLPKILPHKFFDCDFSIYLDSNKRYKKGITKEIIINDFLGDADILIMRSEKTVSDEARLALGRVNDPFEIEKLKEQRIHYNVTGKSQLRVYGFQPLVRRHSKEMAKFNEAWWAEMCRWSYRDQVSFPVAKSMFPNIKFKEITMGCLYEKIYAHGSKTFPNYDY